MHGRLVRWFCWHPMHMAGFRPVCCRICRPLAARFGLSCSKAILGRIRLECSTCKRRMSLLHHTLLLYAYTMWVSRVSNMHYICTWSLALIRPTVSYITECDIGRYSKRRQPNS